MDKIAQERGLLNKLREKTNITGKILESLNPEFQEMMERLRATDEKIRSHAELVKDAVRSAKSHANRRDYLSSATNISAFHERCRWIAAELKKFISSVDMKHYKFLLDQFDDEQKEQLFGYDPNYKINDDDDDEISFVDDKIVTAALKKQAGISDWWFKVTDPLGDLAHNLTTGRGQAMRALEKRFSISFLKDLKINTHIMVQRTQRFLQELLSTFKKLATALAKRNVDQYVEAAKRFIAKFSGYHDLFVKYYNKSIIPLKQQYEKLQEAQRLTEEEKSRQMEEEAAKKREQAAEAERAGEPVHQDLRQSLHEQFVAPNMPGPYSAKAPAKPVQQPSQQTKNLIDALNREEEEIPFPLSQKKRVAEFIRNIEKFAKSNDPKSLMLEILSFSEILENIDSNSSLKLLAIAEGREEEDKTAGIWDFLKGKPGGEKPEEKKETPGPLT